MTLLLPIAKSPHFLWSKGQHVPIGKTLKETTWVRTFIKKMLFTMHYNNGIGLAANQVHSTTAIMVIKSQTHGSFPLINPELIEESDIRLTGMEGCLSFDDQTSINQRPVYTKVKFINQDFEEQTLDLHGMDSVVFQHEYEHLRGLTMHSQHRFSTYEQYKFFRDLEADSLIAIKLLKNEYTKPWIRNWTDNRIDKTLEGYIVTSILDLRQTIVLDSDYMKIEDLYLAEL